MNKRLKNLFLPILIIVLMLACAGALGIFYLADKTLTLSLVDDQSEQAISRAIVQAGDIPVNSKAGAFEINLSGTSLGLIPRLPLQVSAPGYLPREITLFVPLWKKQHTAKIDLEPTQVDGNVIDTETGDPVPAIVYVAGGQSTSVTTDSQGNFTLSHLEPPVMVQVESPGYKSWQTQLEADALYAGPVALEVDLLPQHLIGAIADAWTDDPVNAATVYVSDSQGVEKKIVADDDGHFETMRLEPPLTLQIESPGYQPWQTELAALDLVSGNPAYKLDVILTPRTTGGILLAADTDQPLAGLTVTAGTGEQAQTVTTATDGSFELYRLHPGDIVTVSSPDGYLPVEVAFNNETELSLNLQPRQVTVTMRENFTHQPVPGVQVSLNPTTTVTTDAQGQAILTRVPAAGQLSARVFGYQPVTLNYQDETSLEAVLTPSALQGVVRGNDGQPLPQASLYLGETMVRADDAGHFLLDSLPSTPEPLLVKSAGYHRTYAQLDQTGVFTNGNPPFSGVEGRWLTTAPCADVSIQPGPPCLDFVLEPFQAKGIYISLQYLYDRDKILSYLDFIQATELNAIVLDVKGDYGFLAWDSDVELAETVGAERNPGKKSISVQELITEAKKRNIYTIGRFVVFKDNPLANAKPELAAVRKDGTVWLDGENLAWVNPFKEEVWDYNIGLAKEVAALGFDEINFDYIRFPSDGDVGAIVYEEENTLETRTTAIGEFIKRMRAELDPYGIFVSADVFGLTIWVKPESDMKIGQRVMDLAPYLDYLAPMVYPSTFIPGNLGYDNPSAEPYGIVYRSQLQAEERVPPYVKVRPWLQGYWYSLDEMKKLKQAAIDSNSTGWTVWNAGGTYDPGLFEPAEAEE